MGLLDFFRSARPQADPEPVALELPRPAQDPVPFGRYMLIRKLAIGGTWETFVARSAAGEQRVLKRLLPHVAELPEVVAALAKATDIAATFDHANLVRTWPLEREPQVHLCQELVEGEDLLRVMRLAWSRRMWLPTEVSLAIVAQACAGLHHAHLRTGSSHGDLDPMCIHVGRDGTVKVNDFGIGSAMAHVAHRCTFPMWMSPEVASGMPADPRSDVFATGLIAYELLTRVRPLRRETDIQTREAAERAEIPPPSAAVPREAEPFDPVAMRTLDPLILRALARAPNERYPSAEAFQQAIEAHLGQDAATLRANVASWLATMIAAPRAR